MLSRAEDEIVSDFPVEIVAKKNILFRILWIH